MGTKVQGESFSRALFSMRDLNEESSSSSWPHFYNEKSPPLLQYNNRYLPPTIPDGGHQDDHEKDTLKQKMLEHEAVFKNQVCELHRLYQIQRNMMDEVKRKDVHNFQSSIEPASSSCLQGRHHQIPGFHLLNSVNGRTSGEVVNSPGSCSKKEETEALNGRPLKVRKTFDLQLPADDYIDIEEGESSRDNKNKNVGPENAASKKFTGNSTEMVDLNEPVQFEGASNFLDLTSENTESKGGLPVKIVSADSFHLKNGEVHNLRQRPHPYESGYTRSISGERCFVTHIHRGGVNPSSSYLKDEQRWRPPPGLDSNRNGAYNSSSIPSPFPFLSSFSSPSSWAKPTNGFPHFNPTGVVNPIMEPFPQSHDPFSRKMFGNSSSSRLNLLPFPGEEKCNGFYLGSVSGSKDSRLHSGFDFTKWASSRGTSSKMAIDLNKEIPRSPSDEIVILDDGDDEEVRKVVESAPPLPWLKSGPKRVNEFASPDKLWSMRSETKPTNNNSNRFMGFSVFERETNNEPSSVASTSASRDCNRNSSSRNKVRMIDINVACEPDEDIITAEDPRPSSRVGFIDLNACLEEDHTEKPAYVRQDKRMVDIDLEAPYIMESEEEEDTSLREAAEAVFALSSSRLLQPLEETSGFDESLLLSFANVAVSTAESASKTMDEFESMTVHLEETREEDYMPKPLIPAADADESGMKSRGGGGGGSRRGQTRRGRQRRDFQRDILPGLASLSRHEVSEDLQIFGGLMRAMGHLWNVGSTRGGRGRKRAVAAVETHPTPTLIPVQQVMNHHVSEAAGGGLEDRSLTTSWGKTTRRPRRQRYHPQEE